VQTMTPRDRFLAELRHEEPDRVPYFEYAVDAGVVEALTGRRLSRKETCREFGICDLEVWRKPPVFVRYHDGAALGGRHIEADGLIKSRGDLDLMRFPDPRDPQAFEEACQIVEEKEEFAVGLVFNIALDPMLRSMGYAGFSYALQDDPGLVEEVLKRYVDWQLAALDQYQQLGFDFALSGDDLAHKHGPFFSPAVFRDLLLPYAMQIARAVRVPWILHCDGNILPILDDLLTLGMAGLHPIEPLAMDIFALKRDYGRRLCLIGNIDINTLALGTPEEVREEVRTKIRALAPGGGYVCASSTCIPEYARPENFAALAQAVRDFGQYPIGVRSLVIS